MNPELIPAVILLAGPLAIALGVWREEQRIRRLRRWLGQERRKYAR